MGRDIPWSRSRQFGHHIVDSITHRLEILEILVVDAKTDRPLPEVLFERLDQLDEGQRVRTQVVAERRPFSDRIWSDFQNVTQAATDEVEHGFAVERGLLDM